MNLQLIEAPVLAVAEATVDPLEMQKHQADIDQVAQMEFPDDDKAETGEW
jgi:hypothetical protein